MTSTEETQRPDMWRLRMVRGSSSTSSGDWKLYESRDALERDLFPAAVESEAHAHIRGVVRRGETERWRRFRKWWQTNQGQDDDDRWHIVRIVGVDHLVDGQWVEVEWSISPPVLTLHEPGHVNKED